MVSRWHLKHLCVGNRAPGGGPSAIEAFHLVRILADAVWAINLKCITQQVVEASFGNVEKPDRDVLLVLHELREDLDYLKFEVGIRVKARRAASKVASLWEQYGSRERDQSADLFFLDFEEIEHEAAVLDQFLTNSLDLLIATVTLRNSERAGMLKWLASVFLPLTFVTGIFGMNVRELNDTGRPVWLCFEVLGVVLLVTAAMVLLYKYGGRVMAHLSDGREADFDSEQSSGHLETRYKSRI